MMNYHEMTMNEARDSPARRQQFLVICSVMAAVFAYTAIQSGLFVPLDTITSGPFPGGNYCYKFAIRDYSASMGFGRRIAEDWALETMMRTNNKKGRNNNNGNKNNAGGELFTTTIKKQPLEGEEEKAEYRKRKKMIEHHKLYHIFLDDPFRMGGTRQRFMTGVLVSDTDKAEYCDPLLEKNVEIEMLARQNKHIPLDEKKASEVFEETVYQLVDLPSVDSLVLKFPYTNGFVSALIFSYKILPALRRMAAEKIRQGGGDDDGTNIPIVVVVISQCNKEEQMCTHYAPLVQGKEFLVGQPTTEEFLVSMGKESFLDWEHLKGGARNLSPKFIKRYIDMLP